MRQGQYRGDNQDLRISSHFPRTIFGDGIFLWIARSTWHRSRSTGSVSRRTGAAGLKTIHDLKRPLAFRIPRQIYGQVLKSFFEKGIIGRSRKRHADLRLTPHIRTL
jgi:hypothetical protein